MAPVFIMLATSAEAAEGGTLPQLDPAWWPSQLFWLAISFGAMYLAMTQLFLPKIRGIIEERRNRIADDYDQAAELKSQAEEAEASYNKALADARAKAAAIAAETRAEIDEEIASMQADTEAQLGDQIAAAEKRIDEMKAEASTKVREAAIDTTKAIVEALIDETPTTETVAAAVSGAAS